MGLIFLIILIESGELFNTTKSIISIDVKLSNLCCALKYGRFNPLWTNLSGVIETIKISPNFLADLKCFKCPICNRSNTPWQCTIFFPFFFNKSDNF